MANKTDLSDNGEEIEANQKSQPKEPKTELEETKGSMELTITELKELLSKEKQNLASCEDKLKRSLADFQNLEKKTNSDIEKGAKVKIDNFIRKFLIIYDDFVFAQKVLTEENVSGEGLNSILKNMDSLLSEYDVKPINALGEIFDPNLHEAISVVTDETLDEGTITKEIRKGYISQNRVIRPTIVEITKKSNLDELKGE